MNVKNVLSLPGTHMLVAAGISGVGSYLYLIIVARSVGAIPYSDFSVFWSFAIVAGLGAFVPIEQETARREVHPTAHKSGRPVAWLSFAAALVVAAAALVVALGGVGAVESHEQSRSVFLVAAAAGLLGYSVQFPVRGLLSGQRRLSGYASILTTEGVLRVVLSLAGALILPGSLLAQALVVGVAALLSVVPALLFFRPSAVRGRATASSFVAGVGRLIVGAIVIQVLLNFPPVVAWVGVGAAGSALPGVLLATVTLSRIPVFAYQALQAAVVPRIAQLAGAGDKSAIRVSRGLVLLALLFVAVWTILMGLAGPWIIRTLFGPGFVVANAEVAVVAGVLGALLVAMVVSDCVMAVGGHTFVSVAWIAAGVLAAALATAPTDLVVRSTAPVAAGALLACLILVPVLVRRLRRIGQLAGEVAP
jgi:O-antigen/teichoic acid export membrane protein